MATRGSLQTRFTLASMSRLKSRMLGSYVLKVALIVQFMTTLAAATRNGWSMRSGRLAGLRGIVWRPPEDRQRRHVAERCVAIGRADRDLVGGGGQSVVQCGLADLRAAV